MGALSALYIQIISKGDTDMTIIEFKSLTCGPCETQNDWFVWDAYVSAHAAEKALSAAEKRYGKGRYEWRIKPH